MDRSRFLAATLATCLAGSVVLARGIDGVVQTWREATAAAERAGRAEAEGHVPWPVTDLQADRRRTPEAGVRPVPPTEAAAMAR